MKLLLFKSISFLFVLHFSGAALATEAFNCKQVFSSATVVDIFSHGRRAHTNIPGKDLFDKGDGKDSQTTVVQPKPATADDFTPGSFAATFFKMATAKQLLSQDDPKLVTLKLAFSNKGGICGPTCITNITTVGSANSPNPRPATQILSNFLANYRQLTHTDGRMGTVPNGLIGAAEELPEFKNTVVVPLEPKETDANRISDLLNTAANGRRGSMTSAIILPNIGGHVIEILKIDIESKSVWIADPNYPENVYSTPYRESKNPDGSPKFEFLLVGQYSHDPNDTKTWVTLLQGFDISWMH